MIDLDEFERDGRIWLRGALNEVALAEFEIAADLGDRPGQRFVKGVLEAALGPEQALGRAMGALDREARAVRVVSFNKTAEANWGVPWHQDRVIAVAEKQPVQGYGNWSRKAGMWHCEPPLAVLERMLFVRVHLDDSSAANGGMEIALGSHREGAVAAGEAERVARQYPGEVCQAQRGDVLVLKMLTLHRSQPATAALSRRVFRIDFTSGELPEPLRWAE
jgi:hypothetical protein